MSDDIEDMTPEEIANQRLESTQLAREKILMELMSGEGYDADRIELIVKVASGIDKQEVDKKRISIAAKDSNSNAAMARALEMSLEKMERGELNITIGKKFRSDDRLNSDFLTDPNPDSQTNGELITTEYQESSSAFFERMEGTEIDLSPDDED